MPQEPSPRPSQATLAGWLIIGGSVVLVLMAWQRVSTLHTLEFQEQLQQVLSEPPVSGTGLSVSTLSTIVRVLSMVAAGAATASTILGFQALKRSTAARVALTCLAPLVLVGGFAIAGFFAPMVVAGIAMLWLQPTRDWFAGRAAAPRPPRAESTTPPPVRHQPVQQPPVPQSPVQQPSMQPPAQQPYGAPPPYPAPEGGPLFPAYSHTVPQRSERRPAALVAACSIVWACTALVSGVLLLVSLAIAVGGEQLWAEVERQQGKALADLGVSTDELTVGIYALTAIAVPWCLAAAGLAVGAILGRRWARIALAVSSTITGLVVLVMALASPLLVVLVMACAVTTWLLLRPDVAAWRR
ncbi:hypothetical protein [Nocardioides sp. GY 10113]|uniref:hypothetical protein n=1 Tax=Nocardioides sp. GY 10113 TaxID=2569761 RepID=UPI0019807460|nr:hypothetical protein [Nocardioides sp. GY 10113]